MFRPVFCPFCRNSRNSKTTIGKKSNDMSENTENGEKLDLDGLSLEQLEELLCIPKKAVMTGEDLQKVFETDAAGVWRIRQKAGGALDSLPGFGRTIAVSRFSLIRFLIGSYDLSAGLN